MTGQYTADEGKQEIKSFPVSLFIREPTAPCAGKARYTWAEQKKRLEAGEITKEEYDRWRYTYPEAEAQRAREELDALREKKSDK